MTPIVRAFLKQEADGKQMAAVNQAAAQTESRSLLESDIHRFLDLLYLCNPYGMLFSVSQNS